jgi:hypothetical protein
VSLLCKFRCYWLWQLPARARFLGLWFLCVLLVYFSCLVNLMLENKIAAGVPAATNYFKNYLYFTLTCRNSFLLRSATTHMRYVCNTCSNFLQRYIKFFICGLLCLEFFKNRASKGILMILILVVRCLQIRNFDN